MWSRWLCIAQLDIEAACNTSDASSHKIKKLRSFWIDENKCGFPSVDNIGARSYSNEVSVSRQRGRYSRRLTKVLNSPSSWIKQLIKRDDKILQSESDVVRWYSSSSPFGNWFLYTQIVQPGDLPELADIDIECGSIFWSFGQPGNDRFNGKFMFMKMRDVCVRTEVYVYYIRSVNNVASGKWGEKLFTLADLMQLFKYIKGKLRWFKAQIK